MIKHMIKTKIGNILLEVGDEIIDLELSKIHNKFITPKITKINFHKGLKKHFITADLEGWSHAFPHMYMSDEYGFKFTRLKDNVIEIHKSIYKPNNVTPD